MLERVSHAKVLGVTLWVNLCWGMPVEDIVNKANKRMYMLYQVKRAETLRPEIYLPVVRPLICESCMAPTSA